MTENNTFNNLNLVLTKDLGVDQQITLNTLNKVGLNLDYNKLTSAKSFALNEDGITYTSGATSFNTPLERLCALKTALSAVELPTDTTTLAINKNIKLNDSSDNNLIMEALPNTPYPFPGPLSDYQARITKQTNDNVEIAHLQNLHLRKNVVPSYNVNNLNISYTSQTITPSLNMTSITGTGYSAIFPNNNKHIYGSYNISSKVFYLESFTTPGTYITVDLSSLTTGSSNYSARISLIGIAQIIPVSYTSATNCKFYIRLQENSQINNVYIITCNGDPTLLTSYSYSTFWLQGTSGSPPGYCIYANGTSCLVNGGLPQILSNGPTFLGQRTFVIGYDSVNDYLIFSSATTSVSNNFGYAILKPSLDRGAVYLFSLPTGYTLTNTFFQNTTYNTNCITRIFNNNVNTNGALHMAYWNPTTFTMSISPYLTLNGLITNFYSATDSTFDSFTIDTGTTLNTYFPYINTTTGNAGTNNLYLAGVTWNRTTTTAPTLLFTRFIESCGATLTASNYYIQQYPSLNIRSTTVMELFSPFSNNFYVSNDAFLTSTIYAQTGYNTGYTIFNNAETSCVNLTRDQSINYPVHSIIRGTILTGVYTITNLTIFSVVNSLIQNSTDYLTFDYNLTTNSGSIISTKPITLQANPLTITDASFTNLPTCSSVPSSASQLVNKAYVDSIGGTPALSSVLAVGNSAGGLDIDLNSNDLLNVNSITSSADLLLNPTGSIDANGKVLNMSNGEIHNVPLIHGQNNTDIIIEGKGSGDIILKTNTINRAVLDDTGVMNFTEIPTCSSVASYTTNTQITSKGYVDSAITSAITTASSNYVKTTGNETIAGVKTFSSVPQCATLPSNSSDLVNKSYFDGNAVLLTGPQTITGDKTFSGNNSITGPITISGRAEMLKIIEQTRTPTVVGTDVSFDYNTNAGLVVYLSAPPSSNYNISISNFPTSYPNGSITFSILSNTGTYKTYANSLKLNGSATSETILYNGGSAGIAITTASFVLQTFTVVFSSNTKICVLSSVSPWQT